MKHRKGLRKAGVLVKNQCFDEIPSAFLNPFLCFKDPSSILGCDIPKQNTNPQPSSNKQQDICIFPESATLKCHTPHFSEIKTASFSLHLFTKTNDIKIHRVFFKELVDLSTQSWGETSGKFDVLCEISPSSGKPLNACKKRDFPAGETWRHCESHVKSWLAHWILIS